MSCWELQLQAIAVETYLGDVKKGQLFDTIW